MRFHRRYCRFRLKLDRDVVLIPVNAEAEPAFWIVWSPDHAPALERSPGHDNFADPAISGGVRRKTGAAVEQHNQAIAHIGQANAKAGAWAHRCALADVTNRKPQSLTLAPRTQNHDHGAFSP